MSYLLTDRMLPLHIQTDWIRVYLLLHLIFSLKWIGCQLPRCLQQFNWHEILHGESWLGDNSIYAPLPSPWIIVLWNLLLQTLVVLYWPKLEKEMEEEARLVDDDGFCQLLSEWEKWTRFPWLWSIWDHHLLPHWAAQIAADTWEAWQQKST